MPPRRKSRKSPGASFLRVLVFTAVGVGLIAFLLGYVVAGSQTQSRFSQLQAQFVDGLVQGTVYRTEYQQWAGEAGPKGDPRSNPEQRCAGDYYPDMPVAMSGCLQGIQERPDGGYSPPVPPP